MKAKKVKLTLYLFALQRPSTPKPDQAQMDPNQAISALSPESILFILVGLVTLLASFIVLSRVSTSILTFGIGIVLGVVWMHNEAQVHDLVQRFLFKVVAY